MASYKFTSIIQAIFIILAGISVLDEGLTDRDIMNKTLFDDGGNEFWNFYTFLAYCFLVVAILQLFKSRP